MRKCRVILAQNLHLISVRDMKLKNKKIAIFAENLYEELEIWVPYYRFIEEGAEVKIIGSGTSAEYKGKYGYPVKVDLSIDEANPEHYDAVVIPGGFAPDYMRRAPKMISFIKEMHKQGKVTAAICHGVWMLVSAGILKGKTVTAFFAIKDDAVNAGANFIDEPVARDGLIITSRKPADLPAFCGKIIEALSVT